MCRSCGEDEETSHHVIAKCPAFVIALRFSMAHSNGQRGLTSSFGKGVGQFGEYLASQFGEMAKSVNLAKFPERYQSGDTAKPVNLANLLKGLSQTLPTETISLRRWKRFKERNFLGFFCSGI